MPTQIKTTLGEDLKKTLQIGNFTGNGQVIRAENGTSSLNLRYTNDNEIVLTNDDINFILGFLYLLPSSVAFGFNSLTGLYIEVTATQAFLRTNGITTFFGITPGGAGLSDVSLQSGSNSFDIAVIDDPGADITQNSGSAFVFINTGLDTVADSKAVTGVRRTVLASGKGLTAKTSDTLYCNQISLQESGVLFDCIVKSGTITADRTLTLPDQSGEIMVDRYQSKWTIYSATLDATWETITIPDALPNSIIEIICENNVAATRTMGVRPVGSVLNRYVTAVTRSATCFSVRTNALKQIQVYATLAADISFNFSGQF